MIKLLIILCIICLSSEACYENELEKPKSHSASLDECPRSWTEDEVLEYAITESKKRNYCHRYIINANFIQWQSCGKVLCGQFWKEGKEDLSKPYPKCCSQCIAK